MYYIIQIMGFGKRLRKLREKKGSGYSIRKVAKRTGFQQTYISKVEREEVSPSEDLIVALAKDLDLNPDVLLAMAGKVSQRLQAIIIKKPEAFAQLIEQLDNAPEHAILKVVREVRDGEW